MMNKLIYIACLIALMCSCDDFETVIENVSPQPEKEYSMTFVGSVGFDAESRADYNWPLGSVLRIKLPSKAISGDYIWATYTAEGIWTLTNFNGGSTNNAACEVMYIEGASVSDYNSYYFDACHPIYFTSTGNFSFADDQAQLQATLQPMTGRIRFVSGYNPSGAYANRATYQLNEEKTYVESSLTYATTGLTFEQQEDGKWYSQYIYTLNVPNIKYLTKVYKYTAKTTLSKGQSVVINLPNANSSTGWFSETYSVRTSTNKTIDGTLDKNYYLPNCTTTSSYFYSQIGCVRRITIEVTKSVKERLQFNIGTSAGGKDIISRDISKVGTYEINNYTTEPTSYAVINTYYLTSGYSYTIKVISYSESNF